MLMCDIKLKLKYDAFLPTAFGGFAKKRKKKKRKRKKEISELDYLYITVALRVLKKVASDFHTGR